MDDLGRVVDNNRTLSDRFRKRFTFHLRLEVTGNRWLCPADMSALL